MLCRKLPIKMIFIIGTVFIFHIRLTFPRNSSFTFFLLNFSCFFLCTLFHSFVHHSNQGLELQLHLPNCQIHLKYKCNLNFRCIFIWRSHFAHLFVDNNKLFCYQILDKRFLYFYQIVCLFHYYYHYQINTLFWWQPCRLQWRNYSYVDYCLHMPNKK